MRVSALAPTDWIALLAAALLVAAGLGILVRLPWQWFPGGPVGMALQIGGVLAIIAIGAGLAWLTLAE